MKLTIEIDSLTEAQAIAIEDMMAAWRSLGINGLSRWTSFFADGDGNFHPKILIDGRKPEYTKLITNDLRLKQDIDYKPRSQDEYRIDFDWIAWRLIEETEKRRNIHPTPNIIRCPVDKCPEGIVPGLGCPHS